MAGLRNPWVRVGLDLWMLGAEAGSVVALRGLKMMAGGAGAEAEARRMVSEKLVAAQALQAMAVSGALGFTAPTVAARAVRRYRRVVQANHRRPAKT